MGRLYIRGYKGYMGNLYLPLNSAVKIFLKKSLNLKKKDHAVLCIVSLLVGQGCHSFQIHEEVYGPLNLRASTTICSLLSVKHYTKICIKMWFNRDGSIWEKNMVLKSEEAEVQILDSSFTDFAILFRLSQLLALVFLSGK